MCHETKILKTSDGQSIDIDIKIAPLIEAIWNAGIKTTFSCEQEEDKKMAYIQFTPEELPKFLDRILIPLKDLELPDFPSMPYPYYVFEYKLYPHFSTSENKTTMQTMLYFEIEDVFLLTRLVIDKNSIDKDLLKTHFLARYKNP